ncbi:myotubularin-related protein 10-B-like isoform X7 [Mytilus galloprovincialis]|uniref:myotubularin-related protein 10-B-like isoform X7 n=1 Tax=Mytilus galloprovincialis TaxID=29158 RepID=UPI003F7CBCFE
MSNFISYLTRNETERGKENGNVEIQHYHRMQTFKSYIDEDEDNEKDDMKERASSFFQTDLSPRLLAGECKIAEADKTLSFSAFTDRKSGVSGKLFVTNFKVSFVTEDRSSYEGSNRRQRNLLMGDFDIPLTSIDTVYQEIDNDPSPKMISGGRRRKLSPGTTVSSYTKYIEIHCKNFNVHVFGLKFTPRDQNKMIVNTILHYAYPTKSSLLFAFYYGKEQQHFNFGSSVDTPLYDSPTDWEREINRCRCSNKWWVTDVNASYHMSTSLPERFVVPCGLLNFDLQKASSHFVDRRIPTWCYTHTNGVSLVRMANLLPQSDVATFEERLLTAVQMADNKGPPEIIDLNKSCPSLKDLQSSYDKLKELCVIDSEKDFLVQDINWMSSLENSKWLSLVSQCMAVSIETMDLIVNKQKTVVIKEFDSRNFACLVSSLSQILMDPNFRTQVGFQSLVQREWIMMGHPFQKHNNLIQQGNSERVPVFLLFLDCVWQLLQQFPSSFAFTETYLTSVWDSVQLGLFESFLFDSPHQRSRFNVENRVMRQFRLPPVWSWNVQFSQDDQAVFNNPLYILKCKSQINGPVKDTMSDKSSLNGSLTRNTSYVFKLGKYYDDINAEVFSDEPSPILNPMIGESVIKLWSQCYLRWQTPAQIIGGGNPAQYFQQCIMMEEIIHLQHRLSSLNSKCHQRRPSSNLIFSSDKQKDQQDNMLDSTYLTSSFPFSSGPRALNKPSLIFTPISVYLQNSAIDNDYRDSED